MAEVNHAYPTKVVSDELGGYVLDSHSMENLAKLQFFARTMMRMYPSCKIVGGEGVQSRDSSSDSHHLGQVVMSES